MSAPSSADSVFRSAARSSWSEAARNRAFAAAVLALCLAYVAVVITRSWGPPDEGLLGQSAERLLEGQLPHRDFVDLYTGGLTAIHALAFRLFGTRLVVLRWVLFAAVACWLPIFYAVCRRFATPLGAAAVTLLATVWSVPTYPASMPTWYNLFLATAGLFALCKYAETDELRWMVVAGVCGGLSISIKIIGIYFVGAACLFIVYHAVDRSQEGDREHGLHLPAVVCTGTIALLYLAALVRLIHPTRPGMYLVYIVPNLAAAAGLVSASRRAPPVSWDRLWRPAAMLAVGVAVALLPLVLAYGGLHDLRDLIIGVFILPTRRMQYMGRAPHARAALAVLPLIALFWASVRVRHLTIQRALASAVLAGGLLLAVFRTRTDGPGGVAASEYNVPGFAFRFLVDAFMMLLPVVAVAGAWLLAHRDTAPSIRREEAFAALAVAALLALTSFPFANDLYFFYYAPAVLIATLAVIALWGRPLPPWISAATVAVYVVFGVLHLDAHASAILPLPRGGIRVPPSDSANAVAFVDTLRAHARHGYTYATPDSPEAYFLSGLRNPTPTMYEFFDDSAGRTDHILRLLDQYRVTAVAISSWRIASHDPDPRLLAALRSRYPDSVVVWHYTVRW